MWFTPVCNRGPHLVYTLSHASVVFIPLAFLYVATVEVMCEWRKWPCVYRGRIFVSRGVSAQGVCVLYVVYRNCVIKSGLGIGVIMTVDVLLGSRGYNL